MRHCYVVRVFTDGQSGGNALGVIPDSTELASEQMQEIATELGFSETVFIDWPEDHLPALRIFTPAVELPFAGHPLVGTAWVLNAMGPGADRMSIQIGDVGIRMDGETCWVAPPHLEPPVTEVTAAELNGLGIEPRRGWRVAIPMDYLLVELAAADDVAKASPDLAAVQAACDGLYVFARGEPTRSRFFAPTLGVDEDPATGSAAAALAAVMASEGQATGNLAITQGPAGLLSRVLVSWSERGTELGGTVVHDEVRLLED